MPKKPDTDRAAVLDIADCLLADIGAIQSSYAAVMAAFSAEVSRLTAQYEAQLQPMRAEAQAGEKALTSLMKKHRADFFTAADVVNLAHGSLVRNCDDKVTIPRDALAQCQAQGFDDVVKIAYSLDREAVEKWPDAQLLLIGAERKPVEKFSYHIKEAK
ncbi:MAG TPA: host-nuclease inhibitor Gam family protein [Acidobacteriota bacterium]|nr:host-nuclease inhibitor Gam family protein [Acidobacteriota bacterium]